MKKTIYIVTTRSFNENTLFNKNNCQYVSYKENGEWYKTAFPQYFTDVIQFINIQAVEQIALSEATEKLKKINEINIDNYISESIAIEIAKRTKDTKKKEVQANHTNETAIDKTKKQKEIEELKHLQINPLKTKKIIIEFAQKILLLAWDFSSNIETEGIKKIINLVTNRNMHRWKLTKKQSIETIIINTIIKRIVSESIPNWWPKLLYYKNKCLYWGIEEAKECYESLKTTEEFTVAKSEHSKEVNNQFSLDQPIYKFNANHDSEEWFIVQCFDMRTDPDFGLKYLLSLIKEIEQQLNEKDEFKFNILIHDYDIGRKLIRSSVLLKYNNYDSVLNNIKKALIEKALENITANKNNLDIQISDKDSFLKNNKIDQIKLKLPRTENSEIYSKMIEYISQDYNRKIFEKIDNIIVFKHNKGEVAKTLKSGCIEHLKYLFTNKQYITELLIQVITDLDKSIYEKSNIKKLNERIKLLHNAIKKALQYVYSKMGKDNTFTNEHNFLVNIQDLLEKHKTNDKITNNTEDRINTYIKLLKDISSL